MSNSSNRFEFYANLINSNNLKTGVEIGVWKGEWSNYILKNTKIEQLYQVDTWSNADDIYNNIRSMFSEHKNSSMLRASSKEIISFFEDSSLDFVYVKTCVKDIDLWYPKIKNNGYLFGNELLIDFAKKYGYNIGKISNDEFMINKGNNYIDMNTPSPFTNNKKTTLVTAFYDINRGKWNKFTRSADKYIDSFKKFIPLLKTELFVFIDERHYENISRICNSNENIKLISINEKWLKNNTSYKYLETETKIMNNDEYKNLLFHRINNGIPECIYPEYTMIMHCKIDFVNYVINNYSNLESYRNNDMFCWIDFGIFNILQSPSSLSFTKLNPNKLNFCLRNKLNNNDKDIKYTLIHAPEKFTGTFFAGNIELMKKLQILYHDEIKYFRDNNIADDDQHIFMRCFFKNPDLFTLYLSENKWPESMIYFNEFIDIEDIIINYFSSKEYLMKTKLCEIMTKYGSDKGGNHHNYTTLYSKLFNGLVGNKLNIFELGLGTNNINIESHMGINGKPGASLYGWREFFGKNVNIYGADIDHNILFNDEQIKTYYCDQTNSDIIKTMFNKIDEIEKNEIMFDIIIEDGLHKFDAHFVFLFSAIHKLKPDGLFIIEDLLPDAKKIFMDILPAIQKLYKLSFISCFTIPHSNTNDNTLLIIKK